MAKKKSGGILGALGLGGKPKRKPSKRKSSSLSARAKKVKAGKAARDSKGRFK